MIPRSAVLALLLADLLAGLPAGAAERPQAESAEQCDAFVRDEPGNFEAYLCYWLLARRTGEWDSSIRKVEAGSPHITVGAYLALLDVLGLPTALDRVIAPGDDTLGEALGRNALRKRARAPRTLDNDDFDI